MKIGYKGLNIENSVFPYTKMYGKITKFPIGEIVTVSNPNKLKLCSNTGIHYCNYLTDVINHYYSRVSGHVFTKVEIIGDYLDDTNKSITKALRVLEILNDKQIDEILKEEKLIIEKVKLHERIKLDLLKTIQTEFPTTIVGGSVGLFLHGLLLDRLKDGNGSDLDIIVPYYCFHNKENINVEQVHTKKSGNDFDIVIGFNGVNCDVRIDPYAKYDIIRYDDFDFKVSPLFDILYYKTKYAKNGQTKHIDDLKDLLKFRKNDNN